MKYFKSFFIIILSLALNCCAEADAPEKKSKTNAFAEIDKRDKKLFTKEERIESYNKSLNKSKNIVESTLLGLAIRFGLAIGKKPNSLFSSDLAEIILFTCNYKFRSMRDKYMYMDRSMYL